MDGHSLKWLCAAGLAWLEHNRERVNQMNVFPVPDGDTGTNMCLTMRKAYEAIARMDDKHVGRVATAMASGALKGGRGNSGVILSQLLSGFANTLSRHDVCDVSLFVKACQSAVDYGYQAVINPVEGTILTVARESTATLVTYAQDKDEGLIAALDVLVEAAWESLKNTPELLPVLKKAGVLDSGGQGLVYILEGMSRTLHDKPVHMEGTSVDTAKAQDWEVALEPDDEEGYGYDVQFLMHGQYLDVQQVRTDIDTMGWSTLVVGDDELIKVHVHVHDPSIPIAYAIKNSDYIDDVVVENMQAQYKQYVENRQKREPKVVDGVAVIAVAAGDGMYTLFYDGFDAAYVIFGGQTMNPSTEDFVKAIEAIPNREIILLPNNKNVVMAAQQAASLARTRQVKVIPTKSMPQGISAMLAYSDLNGNGESFDTIFDEMQEAVSQIITCEITKATRDAHIEDRQIKSGQYIGLIDGDLLVAEDELNVAVAKTLKQADAQSHELITLYHGEDIDESDAQGLAQSLQSQFAEQQFEVVYGGQPLYPYIISVE